MTKCTIKAATSDHHEREAELQRRKDRIEKEVRETLGGSCCTFCANVAASEILELTDIEEALREIVAGFFMRSDSAVLYSVSKIVDTAIAIIVARELEKGE
jgi:hypothetical protein